ncbi:hypothetical protein ACQKC7_10935, partial [Pseudoalteromonas tetraodonis]
RSAVSGQRSAVSGQRSAVSGQRSAVSGQRSAQDKSNYNKFNNFSHKKNPQLDCSSCGFFRVFKQTNLKTVIGGLGSSESTLQAFVFIESIKTNPT